MLFNFFKKSESKTQQTSRENLTIDLLQKEIPEELKESLEIFYDYLDDPDYIFKDSKGNVDKVKQGNYLEDFIKALYTLAGYTVTKTPIADKGIDLIAEHTDGQKLIVQCKNHSLKAKKVTVVGDKEVREFNGVESEGQKVFITSSYFSGYIKKDDFPNITFIDRQGLYILIQKLVPEIYINYLIKRDYKVTNITDCPKCKKGVILPKGVNYGKKFYACSNYPNCEYKENKK